jgi:hypothetical protein
LSCVRYLASVLVSQSPLPYWFLLFYLQLSCCFRHSVTIHFIDSAHSEYEWAESVNAWLAGEECNRKVLMVSFVLRSEGNLCNSKFQGFPSDLDGGYPSYLAGPEFVDLILTCS